MCENRGSRGIRVAVLVFAKSPAAGSVNTRLVPPLTPEEAAQLHLASLRVVCERVEAAGGLDLTLVVTPDEDATRLKDLIGSSVARVWLQGAGDLGDRLARGVDRAFREGADRVILLGADSPTLPVGILKETVASLFLFDAALGPCADGGYYLLGLNQPAPGLFRDIDWGSDAVAAQTEDRARRCGIALHTLPPWYDLDRPEDLARAESDLTNNSNTRTPGTEELQGLLCDFVQNRRC